MSITSAVQILGVKIVGNVNKKLLPPQLRHI